MNEALKGRKKKKVAVAVFSLQKRENEILDNEEFGNYNEYDDSIQRKNKISRKMEDRSKKLKSPDFGLQTSD